jgi:hypothetical protein
MRTNLPVNEPPAVKYNNGKDYRGIITVSPYSHVQRQSIIGITTFILAKIIILLFIK